MAPTSSVPVALLQVFSEDDEEVIEAHAAEAGGEDSAKDLKPFHHSSAEHTAGEEQQEEGDDDDGGLAEQVGAVGHFCTGWSLGHPVPCPAPCVL